MNYGYIYKFIFLPTNEWYVGKHKYFGDTLDESYWGSGKKWRLLINSVDRRKWPDVIKREILCWSDSETKLNSDEKYWIAQLNARIDGLNVSIGGQNPILFGNDNGFYKQHHTNKTKMIISKKSSDWQQSHKGVSYSKLRKWQLENPEKYSAAQSKAAKGNIGKPFTNERKENISVANGTKVNMYDANTDELLKTFNSYVKASKYVGFHRYCVKRSCDKNIVYYSKKIDKKIMFKRVGGSVND